VKRILALITIFSFLTSTAWASLNVSVGTFATSTGTGSQAVTGIGFEPQVVIFFNNNRTDETRRRSYRHNVGAATDSTAEFALSAFASDNSDQRDHFQTSVQSIRTEASNFISDFTSMDSDGFTFNISTADGDANLIGYIALGNLEGHYIGSFDLNTSTGVQAISGVGFEPNLILFFNAARDSVEDSITADLQMSFGAASGTSNFAALANADTNGTDPVEANSTQLTTACILGLTPGSSPAVQFAADLDATDSDGFDINITTAPATGVTVFFIAMKMTDAVVGTFNQSTSTGTQTISSVGFDPEAVIFATYGFAASASIQNNATISFGAGVSSTERATIVNGDQDGISPGTDAEGWINNDEIFRTISIDQNTDTEADMVSLGVDQFSIDNEKVDGTSRQIIYIAMSKQQASPLKRIITLI